MTEEADRDAAGRPLGARCVVRRSSEDRAAATIVRGARDSEFQELCSHWFWETGPDMCFTYLSPQVERLVGISAELHIGKTRIELLRDGDVPPELEEHVRAVERREPFDFGYWRTIDGRRRYISTTGKPCFGADGTFLGYRGVARDLTVEQRVKEKLVDTNLRLQAANLRTEDALAELQTANALLAERNAEMAKAQADIRYGALHDPLTGLPNRRYLDEKLVAYAEASQRDGTSFGALHVDLDRFKQINDTQGHVAGDAVLRHVAGMLMQSVTAADFVARVGGDEFVVICADSDASALETLACKLIAELERPFSFEGRDCWFGASVGIAATGCDGVKPAELLVNAGIALDRAKKHGRSGHEFFNSGVQREVVRYKATADAVLAGLKRAEFIPYYQPQISGDSLDIVGVEALARWRHPVEGILSPARFLQIADDLGVVAALDRAILERATDDLQPLDGRGAERAETLGQCLGAPAARPEPDEQPGAVWICPRLISFELLESVFLDEIDDTIPGTSTC